MSLLQLLEKNDVHNELISVIDQDIDMTIIRERNEDMRKLAKDMEHLSDISLSLKELVYEQAEPLETVEQQIEKAEQNTEQATETLAQAETLSTKFRNIFAKGALVSTGVTGAGAATGIFLSPVVGGVAVVIGVGGIIFCVLQMG